MSGGPVRYGKHSTPPPGAACEGCGSTKTRPVTDHCHKHGWVRGLACSSCNRLMGFVDRHVAPKVEKALFAALVAMWHRCPECSQIGYPELEAAGKTTAVNIRFPDELHDWLRQEAFETRASMNSIIVAAVRKRQPRVEHDGRPVNTEAEEY